MTTNRAGEVGKRSTDLYSVRFNLSDPRPE
jgi:hypothetical protein